MSDQGRDDAAAADHQRVFYDEQGNNIPCTMVEAGPCIVTQIKNLEKDGYSSIQLGFDDKRSIRTTQSELGHAKKANTKAKKITLLCQMKLI